MLDGGTHQSDAADDPCLHELQGEGARRRVHERVDDPSRAPNRRACANSTTVGLLCYL